MSKFSEELMPTAEVLGSSGLSRLERQTVLERSGVSPKVLASIARQVEQHGIDLQDPEERRKLEEAFGEPAVQAYLYQQGIRV
ncbi:MAG: hypothetical protein XD95_0544 [Microgenomates bacterium 39_7]|nr:MAG: hypothetical protein XD95_0544 [Microgenomates bacterium 39_7]